MRAGARAPFRATDSALVRLLRHGYSPYETPPRSFCAAPGKVDWEDAAIRDTAKAYRALAKQAPPGSLPAAAPAAVPAAALPAPLNERQTGRGQNFARLLRQAKSMQAHPRPRAGVRGAEAAALAAGDPTPEAAGHGKARREASGDAQERASPPQPEGGVATGAANTPASHPADSSLYATGDAMPRARATPGTVPRAFQPGAWISSSSRLWYALNVAHAAGA